MIYEQRARKRSARSGDRGGTRAENNQIMLIHQYVYSETPIKVQVTPAHHHQMPPTIKPHVASSHHKLVNFVTSLSNPRNCTSNHCSHPSVPRSILIIQSPRPLCLPIGELVQTLIVAVIHVIVNGIEARLCGLCIRTCSVDFERERERERVETHDLDNYLVD